MDRRSLLRLVTLAASGLPRVAFAEVEAETIPLWPHNPPGGEGILPAPRIVDRSTTSGVQDRTLAGIAKPFLTAIRPNQPNGSAILIIPGGGYSFEVFDREGLIPANFFAARGITAFVLTYRLPYEGWKKGRDAPSQDARRAMRILRARGPRNYGLDPGRIGVMGFSAGGHVAALLASRATAQIYAPVDDADALDTRPSFAALIYPVITMLPPFVHESSSTKLLGAHASRALRAAYSAERIVTAETAPTFLCAAADDPDVAVDNTLLMFARLRARHVPCEMHIFEKGGHAFGLGDPRTPAGQWSALFLAWGAARGLFRTSN